MTDAIETDSIMLINAAEIAANGGRVELDVARHASIHLATNPGSGAQQQTSLWQTNSRAIRAERHFGFERLTAEAAAIMSSVGWAAA